MDSQVQELNNVWTALQSVAKFGGASVMFLGVGIGDSASFCARNFAQIAQNRANKAVWLLDLDFFNNGQYNEFTKNGANISGPYDMTFGQKPFWRLSPANQNVDLSSLLVAGRIDQSKLFVSRFRRDKLLNNQSIQIGPMPEYWAALRNSIDMVIVDAPSIDISRAGLALISDMDGIVLVIDSVSSDAQDVAALRDEILQRGGNCLGAIMVNNSQSAGVV